MLSSCIQFRILQKGEKIGFYSSSFSWVKFLGKFLLIHLKTRVPQDFLYLSGFLEPDSALVLHGKGQPDQAILFVPRRDPGRELWDGPRSGKDGAAALTGIERVHSIEELGVVLKSLKGGCMGVAEGGYSLQSCGEKKKSVMVHSYQITNCHIFL